eukprot:1242941-Amphidinium_carterae.1
MTLHILAEHNQRFSPRQCVHDSTSSSSLGYHCMLAASLKELIIYICEHCHHHRQTSRHAS